MRSFSIAKETRASTGFKTMIVSYQNPQSTIDMVSAISGEN